LTEQANRDPHIGLDRRCLNIVVRRELDAGEGAGLPLATMCYAKCPACYLKAQGLRHLLPI
jgi:hypothetical protein